MTALVATGCGENPGASVPSGTAVPPLASPVSGLVDIGGGRKIYRVCQGRGSPTVVLVSGTGGAHDEWTHVADPSQPSAPPRPSESAVLPTVARFTRACAYDRPGTTLMSGQPSSSTAVRQPTTAQVDVADLDAMLAAAEEPGPYLLVGASWGGLVINAYARSHPGEVSGLVFVDAASPFFKQALTRQQWATWMRLIASTPSGGEQPDYELSIDALRAAAAPPAVPTVVLTADKPWNLPLGDAGATWPAWTTAQVRLAESFHASHITRTNSSHGISVEQPRVVSEAIRSVA